MAKNPGGRPTKMTPNVLGKLEEAFAFGCTDVEACLFADINPDTLYSYCKKNPKFSERKEFLKETPILLARQSVIRDMQLDGNLALKYLERKKKDEFSLKQEHEHSVDPDNPLKWEVTYHEASHSDKVGEDD